MTELIPFIRTELDDDIVDAVIDSSQANGTSWATVCLIGVGLQILRELRYQRDDG